MMVVSLSIIVVTNMFLASRNSSMYRTICLEAVLFSCYLGIIILFLHTNGNTTLTKMVSNVVGTVHPYHSTFE